MADQRLIDAYKKARNMIAENPDNKEIIVREYIDLVEKINNYYNGNVNGNLNDNGGGLANMLKNPLEIEIYNNFQKYGASASIPLVDLSQQDGSEPQQPQQLSYRESANILMSLSDY
jgi:hypothetical protein